MGPVSEFAQEMLEVFRTHRLVRRSEGLIGELTLEEAYRVQDEVIESRIQSGEQVIGWKIGCTSRAIQQQFGLGQPISGRLLAPHSYQDGDTVALSNYADCAVEPEMVLRLGKSIDGSDLTERTLLEAIESIAPGIELHNYRFWHGSPTSQELIASNGIHAAIVRGPAVAFDPKMDLDLEGVGIFVDGNLEASGIGAEIMGGPIKSLMWLAQHVQKRGQMLRAGEIIIPGSAVKLVSVRPGQSVEARFTRIGSCHVMLR
jgi:2-keto-4-pentenoate hydratase